jgi:hypothetical protein
MTSSQGNTVITKEHHHTIPQSILLAAYVTSGPHSQTGLYIDQLYFTIWGPGLNKLLKTTYRCPIHHKWPWKTTYSHFFNSN